MLYTGSVLSMHVVHINSFIFHNMSEKQVLLFLHHFTEEETEAQKGKKFAQVMQTIEWQWQDLSKAVWTQSPWATLGLPMKTIGLPGGR